MGDERPKVEVFTAADGERGLRVLPQVVDVMAENERLRTALESVSRDMHNTSMRPCGTCRKVTEVTGAPFGCMAYQARGSA